MRKEDHIIRVFPRKTNATPDDNKAIINKLPDLFVEADEVHISVTFKEDLKRAEYLYNNWKYIAPTKIGGPATGEKEGEFKPGLYVKKGYTITSRGCPNKCWFCDVWKRNGGTTELDIKDGYNILDDNILACSDEHIEKVFKMLSTQKEKAQFTGGIDPALVTDKIAKMMYELKPAQFFMAYDTPDDLEPVIEASKLFFKAGIKKVQDGGRQARCYVLIGYKGDTIEKAEHRLNTILDQGVLPMAMLYSHQSFDRTKEWKQLQREWANIFILCSKIKKQLVT